MPPATSASAPTSSHRGAGSARRLSVLVWLYALAVIGVALLLHQLSDVWWPATLVLFAPRWLWALPLLALVPMALRRRPRLLWVLAATALVLVVPVLGWVPPSPSSLTGPATPPDLRVLTYNIGGGNLIPAEIVPWLDEVAPDVALFQECNAAIEPARAALVQRGWKVEVQHGSCMVSRHPIRKVEVRDTTEIWKMGGSGIIVRYEVAAPGRVIHIVNLHLETVREGLAAVMKRGWGGVSELELNIEQRDIESTLARAFALQTPDALVVAGDFNMPVESAIYRRYWSDFTNAFSSAGQGWGATKATRWHGIRIDHVLLGPGWVCVRAWVGPHLGMDHRPMIAEIAWRGAP